MKPLSKQVNRAGFSLSLYRSSYTLPLYSINRD